LDDFWKLLVETVKSVLESTTFGNTLNIIALFISIIGFIATFLQARRSKNAAEQAEVAVQQVREDIRNIKLIADFSEALSIMDEIKRLHRHEAWPTLPDRYALLRRLLISIRTGNPDLSQSQKIIIQDTVVHLRTMEKQVESFIAKPRNPLDVSKLNTTIANQVDELYEVLSEIRSAIGA
jgi:hypothetical protein